MHQEAYGRVFNLGGVEEVSIDELAQRVLAVTGSKSKVRYVTYEQAYEEGFEDMLRRVPDTTRANDLVGFAPTTTLDQIITSVVEEQRE